MNSTVDTHDTINIRSNTCEVMTDNDTGQGKEKNSIVQSYEPTPAPAPPPASAARALTAELVPVSIHRYNRFSLPLHELDTVQDEQKNGDEATGQFLVLDNGHRSRERFC